MKSGSSVLLGLFRVCLLAYPKAFRSECSAEMEATLQQREAEMRARKGPLGLARFWAREFWAILWAGIRLRFSEPSRPPLTVASFCAQTWFDLRIAVRSLRRTPAFWVPAALTVALGIGATTVIFSFVNGILLSPPPYDDPDGLVLISTFHGQDSSVSEPEFMAFRTRARSLQSVSAVRGVSRTIQVDGLPRRVASTEVTHELFPLLGVSPVIGRAFSDQEDLTDAPRVVVLKHSLWQEMFGSDPGVLGRSIPLDGESFEIIGVMPEGFHFPTRETVLWSPYQIDPGNLDNWNNHYLAVYGRLEDGVDLPSAQAEIRAMGDGFVADHPEYLERLGFSSDLVSLSDYLVGETRTPLLILLGAVGFLLLIGCTNIANLLLARGEDRKQEMAVRSALGASRGRIARQSLTESILLSSLGGAVGILLAPWGIQALRSAAMETVPQAAEIGMDLRLLLFAISATGLTGLLFGLLPALNSSGPDLQTHLKEGGRSLSGSRRSSRIRRVLVASEVALSVILVIGAGVMLRSLANMREIDAGFRTEDVLTLRVSLPEDGSWEGENAVTFYQTLEERVEALPGVLAAGAVARLPLLQGVGLSSIQVGGREVATVGEAPIAELQQVTPGYFQAMDLSLLDGRFISSTDDSGGRLVVMVNEAFARQHWDGQGSVGQRIKHFSRDLPWMEIVGVVKNEHQRGLLADPRPKMYVPHSQASLASYGASGTMNLVVHGEGPELLANPIRDLVAELAPGTPVYQVRTMDQVKREAMVGHSYPTLLLTLFGILALFLASVGIYGLVAFQVNQGQHDIGVHVAMGASASDVGRMVVGEGQLPVLAGVVVGVAGALGLTRLLGSLLYEVDPVDPGIYLGVSAVLILVSATASLFPVLRATRLDPVTVLRAE